MDAWQDGARAVLTRRSLFATVRMIARRYPSRHYDDLVSAGYYAVARGVRSSRLQWAMIDAAREETGWRRTYGPGTGRAVERTDNSDPVAEASWGEWVAALDALPAQERLVMRMLFVEGLSQVEASRRINRVPERVAQIKRKALLRLLLNQPGRAPAGCSGTEGM